MSSIPSSIDNTPQLPPEINSGQGNFDAKGPKEKGKGKTTESESLSSTLNKELENEAAKRAKDALAVLENVAAAPSSAANSAPGSTPAPSAGDADSAQQNAAMLAAVEANPENVVFFAMIDQSTTIGQSISAYYQSVENQNAAIASLNGILTQLDNAEATAEGNGGPNGTTAINGTLQNSLSDLGINLSGNVNSTQIGEAAQSVNNDISTLSTQSSTTMDQLQMLSNDYNTDVQQLSSFLQSIAQTQQGTAHNM